MDEAYRLAMQEQVAQLKEELSEIEKMLDSNGHLSMLAYRAAERNLQLLIEACIGIAKQTLKAQGCQSPTDARQVFAKLKAKGMDPTDTPWPQVIGMRNALVHDYLNFDPERITSVIANHHYLKLIIFAESMLEGVSREW